MRPNRHSRLAAAVLATLALGAAGTATLAPAAALAAEPAASVASVPTSTALRSSHPEAHYGDAGQIVATVKASPAKAGIPTGSVEFLVDGEALASEPLGPTGKAVLPLAELYPSFGVGSHTVSANYLGDGAFAASASSQITQTLIGRTSEAASALTLNEKGEPVFSPSSFSLRYQEPFGCNVAIHNETPNGYQVLYGTPGNWKALRYEIPAGGTGVSLENFTGYFTVRGAANFIRIHCG
jgi:hypothetical protein